MADAGAVLSTALAALAVVYQAYTTVKTSRERCAHLVQRCQLVVDRLRAIVVTNGDAVVRHRLEDLELAFTLTAETIRYVGQQGFVTSLLQADDNALKLEDCQHALSELVSLLNLEHVIDMSTWQRENETARQRDHRELISVGHRLERGNAAILYELSQQGLTLTELSRVVHHLAEGTQGKNACDSPPAKTLPVLSPDLFDSGLNQVELGADCEQAVLLQSSKALPETPPPPYASTSVNALMLDDATTNSLRPNRTSGHLLPSRPASCVEGYFDYRPSCLSNCDKSGDTAAAVRESETVKSNAASCSSSSRMLVELWVLPKPSSFDKVVPLGDFVPAEANDVELVKKRETAIGAALQPILRRAPSSSGYEHMLMLCPADAEPRVIITKTRQRYPQPFMKAYILESPGEVTLVKVTTGRQRHWMLIPCSSGMYVWEYKQYIRKHYGRVVVDSCKRVGSASELADDEKPGRCSSVAFRHSLNLFVSSIA